MNKTFGVKQNLESEKTEINHSENSTIGQMLVEESNDIDKRPFEEKRFSDFACQVDFYLENENNKSECSKTFICNTLVTNTICDVQIQTEIKLQNKIVFPTNQKKVSDKSCGTKYVVLVNKANDPIIPTPDEHHCGFVGILSIKTDEQLIELAEVPMSTFNLFKKMMKPVSKISVSVENRLLIFFCKLKTGLSYSALSVLFSLHRTTISKIFLETLNILVQACANSVRWIDQDIVRQTTPECFKPDYANVRTIIDCTEFPIQIPHGIDNRVYTYSHYKKGFTCKALIGCTPSGYINFKSKCSGGRKSDAQLTLESGLIDLLDDGDVILADKGFPDIKSVIDESGKKILLVMPPFLVNQEFTKEETEKTYSVANVRIHIERINQRIKQFNILNKIPVHLFPYIDDILHICCTLVNLQPPIIATDV